MTKIQKIIISLAIVLCAIPLLVIGYTGNFHAALILLFIIFVYTLPNYWLWDKRVKADSSIKASLSIFYLVLIFSVLIYVGRIATPQTEPIKSMTVEEFLQQKHATPTIDYFQYFPTKKIYPTAQSPTAPAAWHTVFTISGSNGDSSTSSFDIRGAQWRINYVATDRSRSGLRCI